MQYIKHADCAAYVRTPKSHAAKHFEELVVGCRAIAHGLGITEAKTYHDTKPQWVQYDILQRDILDGSIGIVMLPSVDMLGKHSQAILYGWLSLGIRVLIASEVIDTNTAQGIERLDTLYRG